MLHARTKKAKVVSTIRPGAIRVSDPEAAQRLAFIGVTELDLGIVAAWQGPCRARMDKLIDAFYEHISSNATTRGILDAHTTVERQRPGLSRYVDSMFGGVIDDDYVALRRHVGGLHDRIDLDSNWYVAMYEIIREHLASAVSEAGASEVEQREFGRALGRLIQADIAMVITALTDSRRAKIEGMAAKERAFIDQASAVLGRVAERDLTIRFGGEYEGSQGQLQAGLNRTVEELRAALTRIKSTADSINTQVLTLKGTSQTVLDAAERTGREATTVATASRQSGANVQAVASAAEQMSSAIEEISRQVQDALSIARAALVHARETSEIMTELQKSSDEIGAVVKVINDISDQTKLLALNATIEAARAGEAGRGFSVVATEVKQLAADTARSTSEIDSRIQTVQDRTQGALEAIRSIAQIIEQLNQVSEGVAAAMQEQSAATREIARNVAEAAQGTETVSGSISEVAAAAEQTRGGVGDTQMAGDRLAGIARELDELVGDFKL